MGDDPLHLLASGSQVDGHQLALGQLRPVGRAGEEGDGEPRIGQVEEGRGALHEVSFLDLHAAHPGRPVGHDHVARHEEHVIQDRPDRNVHGELAGGQQGGTGDHLVVDSGLGATADRVVDAGVLVRSLVGLDGHDHRVALGHLTATGQRELRKVGGLDLDGRPIPVAQPVGAARFHDEPDGHRLVGLDVVVGPDGNGQGDALEPLLHRDVAVRRVEVDVGGGGSLEHVEDVEVLDQLDGRLDGERRHSRLGDRLAIGTQDQDRHVGNVGIIDADRHLVGAGEHVPAGLGHPEVLVKGFEQVGQPLLLVAKERQRVILGIEGVGEPILGVLQPVGQSILLVAQEGEGVGLGLEGVTCRLEFSGLLPSDLQRVVVGIEGLPPCGHGDVLGVQVGIGIFKCCLQDHQLVGLGRRVVSRDGLGHRDDALVHQLLLNVGLQVPQCLEGIHLGLLRLDGDHGFGDVIEEFRPPLLQVGDLDPYVVLPEALDGGRGIGDLVHELRPPLLLVVDLCLQVVDDEGPGGHAGQRVEAAADRHLQVLVRLAVLVQQRHYLQRRREPSRRQHDRVARIHEVVIHGDVTRDRDRNLQVGGRGHVGGDGDDHGAALLDDDGHGTQRDGRHRRVGCRHSVHHEGCHGHDSHRLASLESDRPTFRRADPYRYGVDGADRVAGWIALERNGHHLVDLRCGPGVSVVGLPCRQTRPRLLGVEPVHVANLVSGALQDRLQL